MFKFDNDEDLWRIVRIKVIGVGDFGAKMVNYSIENVVLGAGFAVVATKNETLLKSSAPQRIKLADKIDEETKNNISELVKDLDLLFIFTDLADENISTQIAELSKDILTIAVVPASAPHKEKFQNSVDTLISVEDDNTFLMYSVVRCVNSLVTEPQLVGLDFSDIKYLLSNGGRGYITHGKATGETPIVDAMKSAINSVNDILHKSKRIFFCIISGIECLSMMEVNKISIMMQEAAHPEAEIVWSVCVDETNLNSAEVIIITTDYDEK